MKQKTCVSSIQSRFLSGCLIILLSCLFSFTGTGTEEDGLVIKSKTDLQSAGYLIDPAGKTSEDDLARQIIGVGEGITINLEAKSALLGNPEELEWIIKDKMGLLILSSKTKGVMFIEAQANPQSKEKGNVTIQVKTSTGRTSKPYEIEVAVPTGASASASNENKGKETSPGLANKYPGVPFASAWMTVRVTIRPLTVNFSNMSVIESDVGYVDSSHSSNNRPVHTPKPSPQKILPTNQFWDEVALDIPITQAGLDELVKENPLTWGHKCDFHLCLPDNAKKTGAGILATTMDCSVSVQGRETITIRIDKFSSTARPVQVIQTTTIPENIPENFNR